MLKTVYYQFYIAYKKTKLETEPALTAAFLLGVCESFFVRGILDFLYAFFFCSLLSLWMKIVVTAVFIILNIWIFIKKGLAVKVVKEKPLMLNSLGASRIFAGLFFLITITVIIWMPEIITYLLNTNCKF